MDLSMLMDKVNPDKIDAVYRFMTNSDMDSCVTNCKFYLMDQCGGWCKKYDEVLKDIRKLKIEKNAMQFRNVYRLGEEARQAQEEADMAYGSLNDLNKQIYSGMLAGII